MSETPDQPERVDGNEAVRAAAERAEQTRHRNLPQFDDLPGLGETANLRMGPSLNDACLSLLPLVGVWRGEGEANHPSLEESYRFYQQITIAHDGRPFLSYESISWRLDRSGGEVGEPDLREFGFFRPQQDDSIEFMLLQSTGVSELFFGKPRSQTSWEFGTDAVLRSPTGEDANASSRLYGIVEGALAYVEERASSQHELQPRLSAKLDRLAG